jgi:hypothetical protein
MYVHMYECTTKQVSILPVYVSALRFDVGNQVAECQVTERRTVERILSKRHIVETTYCTYVDLMFLSQHS